MNAGVVGAWFATYCVTYGDDEAFLWRRLLPDIFPDCSMFVLLTCCYFLFLYY